MMRRRDTALGAAMAALLATFGATAGQAATIRIDFTNEAPANGLFFTPFLGIAHDGSVDTFDAGARASAALQDVAEEGFVDQQIAAATAAGASTAVALGTSGVNPPPVIDPGETATAFLDVDPANALYFSFLSMVIPSNDTFIGNDDPLAFRLFDDAGQFVLTSPISVGLGNVYDGGSEANLATATEGAGAAFTPGFAVGGGTPTDENVTAISDLSYLLGLGRVPGGSVGFVPGQDGSLATIRVSLVEPSPVPLPAAAPLLLAGLGGLGGIGALRARRRRRAA